jgi:hypothetical protein
MASVFQTKRSKKAVSMRIVLAMSSNAAVQRPRHALSSAVQVHDEMTAYAAPHRPITVAATAC